ncbi:DUF4453 domain-containing protein [Phaeobacter sp.]|uniref:DUF4453 domain-containing protein n=1 Tax=Phaeobacter sp. TaxID=1902409 RepID=UPI0025FF9EB9|nr:DUF4453 domain-containing protein [Phaeobacter sp.]
MTRRFATVCVVFIACALTLFSSPSQTQIQAQAKAHDPCEDLWFTRNLIMDRAGLCFASELGQRVFGNQGCLGTSVLVDAKAARLLQALRGREQLLNCQIDTSAQGLRLPDASWRMLMIDLPVASQSASICIGWRADPAPLHSGRDSSSARVGIVRPNDTLRYRHDPVGNWHYVTVHDSRWRLKAAGWLRHSHRDGTGRRQSCTQVAAG